MNKIAVCILIYSFLFLMFFGGLSTYNREVEVTEVHGDEIVAIDQMGNEWVFFGDEVKVGDNLILRMHDKGTSSITDDEVQGWCKR